MAMQRERRLGRPRKPPGAARTELVRVYLTPAERGRLAEYAHACNVREAELLRLAGLGADPRLGESRVDPAEEPETAVDVRFRLPAGEYALLDDLARREGLLLGAFLRRCAFERGGPALSKGDAMRLVYELNAIGNNLNQAVRDLHAGSSRAHDWVALRSQLSEVLTEVALRYVR